MILVGGFCGKNPKNKSYRMPFIVKKCKLFRFIFPKFKHSRLPRGPIIWGFAWNNSTKGSKMPNVYKCLNSLVSFPHSGNFAASKIVRAERRTLEFILFKEK